MWSFSNQYDRLDSLKHPTLRFSQKVLVLLAANEYADGIASYNNLIKLLSLIAEMEPT